MKLSEGSKAPDFTLKNQDGKDVSLADFGGKRVLLYFYPKDDTPGCTKEACGFRDSMQILKKIGIVILGVSVDSVASHKKFATKYKLPFDLLADVDKTVVQAYGVWGKKKFMGREYMGTNRVSFMIGPDGMIEKIYETVKPDTHPKDVVTDGKTR